MFLFLGFFRQKRAGGINFFFRRKKHAGDFIFTQIRLKTKF